MFSRNVSKTYIPPNRNLISKEILDIIHKENTKRNLAMIKKEAEIFGLLFLGDGAIISICPLLNILYSGKNILVTVFGKSLIFKVVYLMAIKRRSIHL